jgi:pimeloyl-ACP methyl ester carboxylesterase
MGGMLAMAAQATGVIDAPAIVTAASPFSFGMIPLYPPLMRSCIRLSAATGYRTIPIRLAGRILCAFLTAAVPGRQMYDLNLFRYLIKQAAINVPVETLLQALIWTKTRKFTDRTGKKDYLEQFGNIKAPVCLIFGSQDRIAPERTVEAGYYAVASRKKAIVSIAGGTHINMTAGKNARLISELARAWCCDTDD